VILKPRRVQPGLGPVVISLATGTVLLLAGLVNGCQISKLLSASSEATAALVVTPNQIHDSALVGTSTERVATLSVSNGGGWSATTGDSWIRMSPSSGAAHGTVRLSLDPKFLPPGPHEGVVTVSEKESDGASVSVDVTFLILQPILSVEPDKLFYTVRTDNSVFNDTLSVTNKGNGPLPWTVRVAHNSRWITLGATSGDGPGKIPVRVSNEGLNYFATYRDTIVVESPGAKNSPARIAVQIKRKHD
jgi:hypothetical protein